MFILKILSGLICFSLWNLCSRYEFFSCLFNPISVQFCCLKNFIRLNIKSPICLTLLSKELLNLSSYNILLWLLLFSSAASHHGFIFLLLVEGSGLFSLIIISFLTIRKRFCFVGPYLFCFEKIVQYFYFGISTYNTVVMSIFQ